jgi:TRAP-type C4-dicarboxylate transport system permease small subunit
MGVFRLPPWTLTVINTIDNALARLEGWLIIVFLWVMVILTFVQVGLRTLYTHARLEWANQWMAHLDWSETLVRLLVLWLAFLGASLLTRENKHIKIDLFAAVLPKRWLPLRELLLSSTAVVISAVMFKVCIGYVALEKTYEGTLFLGIPGWICQLIMPLGFGIILFRFLLRALRQVAELRRGPEK